MVLYDIYRYMEIRKLQRTGGASLTLTLPKKWASNSHLNDKDSVAILVQKSGSLVVNPYFLKSKFSKSVIQADGFTSRVLRRELIAHYISGVEEIVIKNKAMNPKQRKDIRLLVSSLVGFEIVDESSEEIFLKNIFSASKFPIQQNIAKMFQITKSMLSDVMQALQTKDKERAKDIIDRDFEIDKLNLAITRQFHSLIRDILSEEEINLDSIDLNYYDNISTQLERIADHAVKIARAIIEEKELPKKLILLCKSVFGEVLRNFGACEDMVSKLNKNMAHKILDTNPLLEKLLYLNRKRDVGNYPLWFIVLDSFDRIRGYIMNISEFTIDQAVTKTGVFF